MKRLLILVLLITACGASTREKTLETTLASVEAAEIGFDEFSAQHQQDIAAHAPDKATGEAQLATFRTARDKVEKGITAAYRAIAAAATINNDPSVAAAVQAAAIVAQELKDLGVSLP